jgi:hypothetical protein
MDIGPWKRLRPLRGGRAGRLGSKLFLPSPLTSGRPSLIGEQWGFPRSWCGFRGNPPLDIVWDVCSLIRGPQGR